MSQPALVVVAQSLDVARSLGRPGLLEARLAAVGSDASVVRESSSRFDVVAQRLAAGGVVPDVEVPAGLGEWFAGHFSTAMSTDTLRLGVLSLRDELTADVWRHREHGWLVQPPDDFGASWTETEVAWLQQEFERAAPADAAGSMAALREIGGAIAGDAVLVVFNASTYDPEGVRHDFADEVFAIRAHRMNLALERVASELEFVAIVDVDRSVAEFGGARAVEAPVTYTDGAGKVIAEDALNAINELGVEGLTLDADVMRLDVPAYDRRTTAGRIDAWHVTPGTEVERGAPLFDMTFDNLIHRLDYAAQETNRSMSLTVLAADAGRVTSVAVEPGAEVSVGQTVGVVVKDASVPVRELDDLGEGVPPFRIGIRVK